MKLPATFDDLISKAKGEDLYLKLVGQLNKDLNLANIDLQFDEEILPSSLKFMLHETIFGLIQDKFADYLNFLYIIDVPEAKIKKLDGSDLVRLSEEVTFLVLQREWQKVWLKATLS
ncbi:MAG: hypothetical protein KJO49_11830 [Bacteroidia bacterium]|nr:hypothetical protein [Bacteroidia bacterium]MBT8270089.1 hypothetical protein [Bacteroidia bacterium]NNF82812.1 hypothetical protein [Flavobacteriaceae bacterium]NNK69698.1 hypothetical protein [Flavobacteriaceae bacterium]NNL80139.1 hypothetical protein [Flavobacteriaceae bacterium]